MRSNFVCAARALILCGLLLPGRSLAGDKPLTKPTSKVITVSITGFTFKPAQLEVNTGDTVIWKNDDIVPHTATGKQFDSKNLNQGQSWTYVAKQTGSFPYRCAFHPGMKGILTVKKNEEKPK